VGIVDPQRDTAREEGQALTVKLSPRLRDVLALKDMSNKQIADELGISINTVKVHMCRLNVILGYRVRRVA
jgi:DNA-binding NarL/FixJ family response regulator